MSISLAGTTVTVLGGDDRELILIPHLADLGADVRVIGFDKYENKMGAEHYSTIEKAITNADAVILPMPGIDNEGRIRAVYSSKPIILTEFLLSKLRGKPLFIGAAKSFLKDLCSKYDVKLIEVAEIDEIAVYNSIPTAEGALQVAIQETPITIHNSCCFVLGYGRVGLSLAKILKSLNAEVFAVSREEVELARAFEQGCVPVNFDELAAEISKADVIFNTIPAKVLNKPVLERTSCSAVIIDLASAPGGTDFEIAEKRGIKAILTPGLPGKVAPKTAGKILAEVLPKLILKHI